MAGIWSSFRDCGSTSWIILFLTVIAIMDAVASAVIVFASKNKQLGVIMSAMTLLLGVAILAAGAYGQISGQATTEDVLKNGDIDPDQRDRIRVEGFKEAAQCVSIGIGGGTLPLIFGFVLLPIALFKKKPEAVEN